MDGVVLLMAHCDGHRHRRGTGHCTERVEVMLPSELFIQDTTIKSFLTCLGDPEVPGVALPPVQVASIGPNLELILVASL